MLLRLNKNKILPLIVLLIIVTMVSSYIKESLFTIINYLLLGQTSNYANIYPPEFLLNATEKQLTLYKWIILALNISIINSVNIIFLRLTKQDKLLKIYLIFIFFIFISGVIFLLLGKTFFPLFIEVSRVFQNILESPFIIFILIIFYFFPFFYQEKQPYE